MELMLITARYALVLISLGVAAQAQTAQLSVRFDERLGPLKIHQMALGQGGLSSEPMWVDRTPEIRALNPAIVRIFIQEYFTLLPERGRYHFDVLDRSIDTILATGAQPLMCICFKPKVLFPEVNQDIVEPKPGPFDEGARRVAVTDPNWGDRVIRRVGWRTCMHCAGWFFSPDVSRIRLHPDGCGEPGHDLL